MGVKRLHRETAGQPRNRLQKYYIRDNLTQALRLNQIIDMIAQKVT